uniref:HAUS augmin like complex subunit 8 n=1 Tax=Sphenodon punctatus TaxID=8508 RepID=A0A8D0GZE7_SPHPU
MAGKAAGGTEPGAEETSGLAERTGARPKAGGRIVKSRYLDYDRKEAQKSIANISASFGGKGSERGTTPARRLVGPPKSNTPAGTTPAPLAFSGLGKDVLQSTLVEGHKSAPPDLDLSDINDNKGILEKTSVGKRKAHKKEQSLPSVPEDIIEMMESQALLLTYLAIKRERNLAQLEEKAERDLLVLCEERGKLQEKAYKQKRRLLLQKRELQLAEALDRQLELLSPLASLCERFKEEYKTFATAVDSTRHELPLKNIHVEGSRDQLLGASLM